MPAGGAAEREDRGRGERRAGEREPDVAGGVDHAEERDGQYDAGRGAEADPEQAGLGKGVAGERLHDGAGQAECGADADAEQGARQAQLVDDHRLGRAVGVPEHPPDGAEVDVAAADRDAQRHRGDQDGDADGQAGPAARGSGGRPSRPARRARPLFRAYAGGALCQRVPVHPAHEVR
nr:hypothetical protein GCM10020092_067020 [Actinoplanes digitatis]